MGAPVGFGNAPLCTGRLCILARSFPGDTRHAPRRDRPVPARFAGLGARCPGPGRQLRTARPRGDRARALLPVGHAGGGGDGARERVSDPTGGDRGVQRGAGRVRGPWRSVPDAELVGRPCGGRGAGGGPRHRLAGAGGRHRDRGRVARTRSRGRSAGRGHGRLAPGLARDARRRCRGARRRACRDRSAGSGDDRCGGRVRDRTSRNGLRVLLRHDRPAAGGQLRHLSPRRRGSARGR